MYCSVIFYSEKTHGYCGRSYTYETNLDLKVSDKVLCPIGGETTQKRAMVIDIDLSESNIDDSWKDKIKTISEYDYTNVTQVL